MATRALRRKALAAVTVGLTAALVGSTLISTAGAASGASTAAVPADLTLVRTKHSLLGTHRWYQQTFKGLPVVGGYYAQHLDADGRIGSVDDGRDTVPVDLATTASVDRTVSRPSSTEPIRPSASRCCA